MITHSYKYTYGHHIPMSTFERVGQLDLEIHEVVQRVSHCRWRHHPSLKNN
jgi:hypothetical protein